MFPFSSQIKKDNANLKMCHFFKSQKTYPENLLVMMISVQLMNEIFIGVEDAYQKPILQVIENNQTERFTVLHYVVKLAQICTRHTKLVFSNLPHVLVSNTLI